MCRYDTDPYDRYWWPMRSDARAWKNISTMSPIKLVSNYDVPLPVIQTAIEAVSTNTTIIFGWLDQGPRKQYEYRVYLHFADFQNSQLRQFSASFNTLKSQEGSPPYLAPFVLSNNGWYKSENGAYNITLNATAASKLPPMINAVEIYSRISHVNPKTFPRDCKHSLSFFFYSIPCLV